MTYAFRYLNAAGRLIRWAEVQCHSDESAIRYALKIMSEPFGQLEIYKDDVEVHRERRIVPMTAM